MEIALQNIQTPIPKTRFDLWYVVRGMLHEEECEEVIEQMKELPISTAETLAGIDKSYRDSMIKWVPQYNTSSWKWLYYRIWKWAKIANDDNWHFEIQGFKDAPQYTEYNYKDKGHYDWHQDCGGEGIDHRKISMSCVLDPCTKGGEFEIKGGKANTLVELNKGDAVFFPSWMLHRVKPVLAGHRTSLVSWVSGQPYR